MRTKRFLLVFSVAVALGWSGTEIRGEPPGGASEPSPAGDSLSSGQGHPLPPRQAQRAAKMTTPRMAGETALPGRSEFWWSSFGGVCMVVALVLVGARLVRRWAPLGPPALPREALEVLGRSQLAPKHTVYLVRCGKSLLVVGTTAEHVATLAEIADPAEVDYLAGICRQSRDRSATASFREVLQSQTGGLSVHDEADAPAERLSQESDRATGQIRGVVSQLLEAANVRQSNG